MKPHWPKIRWHRKITHFRGTTGDGRSSTEKRIVNHKINALCKNEKRRNTIGQWKRSVYSRVLLEEKRINDLSLSYSYQLENKVKSVFSEIPSLQNCRNKFHRRVEIGYRCFLDEAKRYEPPVYLVLTLATGKRRKLTVLWCVE